MFVTPHPNTALPRLGSTCRGRRDGAVAVLSLCAIALVAAVPQARAETRNTVADPRSLSVELTIELQLVYRDNVPEFTLRSEQLRQAITAWNASGKSRADRKQMAAWLHEAIRVSMPGSAKQLPPVPSFASTDAKTAQPSATQSVLVAEPLAPKSLAAKTPVARVSVEQHDTTPGVTRRSPTEHSSAGDAKEPQPATGAMPQHPTDDDPFRDDAAPD
jgi:hypothetical protein